MKISKLEKYTPYIVECARKNLAKFNFGSHTIDEEIESTSIEYLIAYAYREKINVSIPDCISLLGDYNKLIRLNKIK